MHVYNDVTDSAFDLPVLIQLLREANIEQIRQTPKANSEGGLRVTYLRNSDPVTACVNEV